MESKKSKLIQRTSVWWLLEIGSVVGWEGEREKQGGREREREHLSHFARFLYIFYDFQREKPASPCPNYGI